MVSLRGAFLLGLLVPGTAGAAWPTDPATNVPLCTAAGWQNEVAGAADGAGGAIFAWKDARGADRDIYAQRVDVNGVPLWSTNGVVVSSATGDQERPLVASDGSGGVILTWLDERAGTSDRNVYAQRLDASGAPQWTANGVALCTASGNQFPSTIVSDGAGGAIVAWTDFRDVATTDLDVYAQRVSAAGSPLWSVNGVPVVASAGSQETPSGVPDGSGGALLAIEDDGQSILVCRIDDTGSVLWSTEACTAGCSSQGVRAAADGSGGVIVVWEELFLNLEAYAQRVSASGSLLWNTAGVELTPGITTDQEVPQVAADGTGGGFFVWQDSRTGDFDVYSQRVSPGGALLFGTQGDSVCTAPGFQPNPQIVSDGSGGAFVAWDDERGADFDVYAQRILSSGAQEWITDGDSVSTATDGQQCPAVVSVGSGTAILAWSDFRGTDVDVYAQRVPRTGTTTSIPDPAREGAPRLGAAAPNPFSRSTTASYHLDAEMTVQVDVINSRGRLVRELQHSRVAAGRHAVSWDGRNARGALSGPGVYFLRLRGGRLTEVQKVVLLPRAR